MALNISDEDSNKYEEFKKNQDLSWIAFTACKDGASNKLCVEKACDSGITGINSFLKENYEDKVAYAVLRVKGVDERGGVQSLREKFVFISYIGNKCPPLRKARTSTTSPMVKDFLGSLVQYTGF